MNGDITMTRNKFPSQIKYDLENPVVAVRLTKGWKGKLDKVRDGKPYSKIVKEILLEAVENSKQLDEARKTIQKLQKEIELLRTQKQA